MFKRDIYIENKNLEEALALWQARLEADGLLSGTVEEIRVDDALDRITAEAVFARRSSPFYNASAMDGIAVRFRDTIGASEARPLVLTPEQYVPVNTGNALPAGFDAVIMIEDVHEPDAGRVEIIKAVTPWQHVRTVGEDIVVTELVLAEGHRIRPIDLGALLAAGITTIKVRKRPTVLVIPTGSELVQPEMEAAPGNIIEFNSRILAGYASQWGAKADRSPIVADEPDALRQAIGRAARDYDLVLLNAGASAGSRDFSAAVLRELGEVVVHGVNIKPGKPVILAIVGGKPVIGLPGYPISAVLTMRLFVKPLIYNLQGLEAPKAAAVTATLARPLASKLGVEDFVRVKVGKVGDTVMATPISRGAGAVMTLVRADGILTVPAGSEGVGAGQQVEIELLRDFKEITDTLVFIGSHDNILDVLANFLHRGKPVCFLSSAHVGSMGGIMAIKRGEAHLAGTHLLDEASGAYNIPFIKKYLAGVPLTLVNLAYREQGFLVPPGNPEGIKDFQDIAAKGLRFINRQRGAGTRILTDLELKKAGIDPSRIAGYEHEEYTHMNVASAVASGLADAGLGIRAAARALHLDFVPVAKERYDLIIPEAQRHDPKIERLLAIIEHDPSFKSTVEGLGGYDLKDSGRIFYQQ